MAHVLINNYILNCRIVVRACGRQNYFFGRFSTKFYLPTGPTQIGTVFPIFPAM